MPNSSKKLELSAEQMIKSDWDTDKLEPHVSIIIPCRNEKNNIEAIIKRTPCFGASQEFIFVEGHSTDGTREEVERVIKAYPDKTIKLYTQTNIGKNDAVFLGLAYSSGDIVIIFDCDLTIMPEDMTKFYTALQQGQARLISGSRLILPMEKGAMPLLNLISNKLSAMYLSWLLGIPLTDVLCGIKALSRKDYIDIFNQRTYWNRWDPWGDFDLLLGASKLKLKVQEIPICYKCREYGKTKIRHVQDSLLVLRIFILALWKIKVKKWQ